MSRRFAVASKTAFDLLRVDQGDESSEEEELVEEEPAQAELTPAGEPTKLTKTAQRKAAKAARLAKKQDKARSKQSTPDPSSSASGTPAAVPAPQLPSEDATVTPSTTLEESGVLVEPERSQPPVETVIQEPIKLDEPTINGEPTTALEEPPLPPPVTHPLVSNALPAPTPVRKSMPVVEPAEKPAANGRATTGEVAPAAPAPKKSDDEKTTKKKNVVERTVFTLLMIGGFITLLLMGHPYMIMLVFFCQTLVYREVTALFSIRKRSSTDEEPTKDPWSKTLNWYFFAVTNYFLYGESIIYYFKHIVFVDAHLTTIANKHRIISFSLYTIGFVGFVGSLKRGYLKQQFGLFCWVHMSLLLIVVSSHFIVNNILEGLIWFWVPASLVICNDIFAYICGMTFGRTPLIALSPKKTVEGFIGAFFCTVAFGLLWGSYFMRFNYMTCPVHDLGTNAFSSGHCKPNSVFVWREAPISPPLSTWLTTAFRHPVDAIPYTQYHFHLLVLAVFASLVAPFGGFFASGFKRAFNIKDFGHSIPGHGGMTDRMDCQFLMGVFTYVYYSSLVRESGVTVGSILQMAVSGLTLEEQLELVRDLKQYLEGQGAEVRKLLAEAVAGR